MTVGIGLTFQTVVATRYSLTTLRTKTIPVPVAPVTGAFDPYNNTLVVDGPLPSHPKGGWFVATVSTSTGRVLAKVPAPSSIAFLAVDSRLGIVSIATGKAVMLINSDGRLIRRIATASTGGIVVDPSLQRIFLAAGSHLLVFNAKTGFYITSIDAPFGEFLALNKANNKILDLSGNRLVIINAVSNRVISTIRVSTTGTAMAVDGNRNLVLLPRFNEQASFYGEPSADQLVELSATTGRVDRVINTPNFNDPIGCIDVFPTLQNVVICGPNSGVVIDLNSGKVSQRLPQGSALAADPGNGTVFWSESTPARVLAIRLGSSALQRSSIIPGTLVIAIGGLLIVASIVSGLVFKRGHARDHAA